MSSNIQVLYNRVAARVREAEAELERQHDPVIKAVHSARRLAYASVLADIEALFVEVDKTVTEGRNLLRLLDPLRRKAKSEPKISRKGGFQAQT
jgi:hypothetical protein